MRNSTYPAIHLLAHGRAQIIFATLLTNGVVGGVTHFQVLVWHNSISTKTDREDKDKADNVFSVPNLPQVDLVMATGAVCGVITVSLPGPNLLDQAFS